jgi:hypothetical protein
MKPNLNDLSRLQDVRRALAEKNVSPTAISTLELALKRGMSFERAEDVRLLDIPGVDVAALADAVTFGPAATVASNIKSVEYRFNPIGDQAAFYGYQLLVRFVNQNGFTIEECYPIEDGSAVVVDYDLSVLRNESPVILYVNAPSGNRAKTGFHGVGAGPGEFIAVRVPDLASREIDVTVEPPPVVGNPAVNATYPVRGRVVSNKADAKLDGYQVVLFAATTTTNNAPDVTPVAVAHTETNGYFITAPLLFDNPENITRVTAAKASVTKGDHSTEVPIRLLKIPETANTPPESRIPDRVILVITEGTAADATAKDGSCGCNDLNFHEKKVLEEYSYYTVVRTSEPSIIADVLEDERDVDLQDIYGVPVVVPFTVFKKFHEIQSRQSTAALASAGAAALAPIAGPSEVFLARPAPAPSALVPKTVPFNHDLLNRLMVDHKVNVVVKGDAKPVFRGRTHLNQLNQVDWDDTPTIYQAASIAHGHLLHFKQEWMPDGYSIGDLVYSLPLAPGQKKQIAVLDWERRESAANSQQLDYEETLNNTLVRDRDINEVVAGTLTENIRGNSKATTAGIGFGMGSSVMGIIPGVGTFGSLLGISGGASSAGTTANQSATREATASSLQSITDRTQQAASVVRSQRATVVQTVSQGERVQATAESVANYNHCHAITIQYFEVLRHFTVRNRLAGVQECLFVPLQMTPFDLEKCLRWRTSLEKHLFQPALRGAFDAVARVQNEKESAFENYYDSIGFPRKNFAEQAIGFYSGELFMDFFFFNTNQEKIDDAIVAFYSFFGISLDSYRDKKITDDELARHVGPRAIEYLLDAFRVVTDKGVDLRLDLTLLSTFRQNTTLRISLRESAGTPRTISREAIDAITIRLDLSKLSPEAASSLTQFQNKYMKIRLRSGTLRYRTDNFAGTLFDERIDNDIFAGSDGAYVATPLTRDELRNPRGEDVDAVNNLLHHLNENLEYYHKCLFFDFTPERRFMLLDGIIAPGKAHNRSVASVVENRVIGIAGNSLIMPVAPGYQLDPTIDATFDLFAQYYHDEPDPLRISMPTKGVFAEAVMGKCNSCEEKDESRFWRWEESPIPDSPNTQILPLNTDTRRADPGNLQAKDFPTPVVNIQNAPNVPDPAGLQALLQTLGKADAFRDLTGLNQNQLNALAAYQKAIDSAGAFGKEAAELAKTMATVQMAKDAQKSGSLSNEDTKEIVKQELKKPDPEKERADTVKDLDVIDQAKQNGQVDEDQSKGMSEDVVRKKQGTTKPTPSTTPKKGKRKYRLTLMLQDPNGKALDGTWVINYGSLREETFETTTSSSVKTFDVELDPSIDNVLQFKGNPYLANASFPPGSEYYYHYVNLSPELGTNRNLTFTISQRRRKKQVTASKTASTAEIKTKAVAEESGTQSEVTIESGGIEELLLGKIAGKAIFFGKVTDTNTSGTTTTTSDTDTETYAVDILASRLATKQKGQASGDLDVDD